MVPGVRIRSSGRGWCCDTLRFSTNKPAPRSLLHTTCASFYKYPPFAQVVRRSSWRRLLFPQCTVEAGFVMESKFLSLKAGHQLFVLPNLVTTPQPHSLMSNNTKQYCSATQYYHTVLPHCIATSTQCLKSNVSPHHSAACLKSNPLNGDREPINRLDNNSGKY